MYFHGNLKVFNYIFEDPRNYLLLQGALIEFQPVGYFASNGNSITQNHDMFYSKSSATRLPIGSGKLVNNGLSARTFCFLLQDRKYCQ